ncbi:MAG: excinuclease ABC subunit UvrC [Xanthomonadales bacterium]|jgi:excinuclease ABC subunit C|nr:excinuclease ABC subunit UvrC [Xanthomonadales bacterium]
MTKRQEPTRKPPKQGVNPDFDGKAQARKLPTGPGVYLFRDDAGTVLYVGKAANLRKRVASYFDARPKGSRIMRMISRIRDIETALTRNEAEALLLENEWIKAHRPRYNVLLRDDKSYPWIVMTTDHDFPRIAFHRGKRKKGRTYLGPYPSASSVRESINLIQKTFRVRNCQDSVYANRSRPCLQYQIKRCTAPCVGYVSEEDYAAQVDDAMLFLKGQSDQVITRLIGRMEAASKALNFEEAALYRDRINILKKMQAQQFVSHGSGDIDVIALARERGQACVQVMTFRGGRNLGQRSYFPTQTAGAGDEEVLEAFLGQYYRERMPPTDLLLSHPLADSDLYAEVFSERAGRKVTLQARPRGERRQWLELTKRNAEHALQMNLASDARMSAQFEALREALDLEDAPETLECFDISHTAGNQTVGSCVVFDQTGPVKSHYRRFNLRNITPGDDYAAMRQVLERRYRRLREEDATLPGLVIVDGGKGQLGQAAEVLEELGLGDLPLMGVAKGPTRRAGEEEWVRPGRRPLHPGPESPASHLVQHIRDEAHRFAITGHRGRRQKANTESPLEGIQGVGAARRKALLSHFGGIRGVRSAGVEELASVPGVSRNLAQRIFDALH